eukprot:m.207661 g.207661  ORF g.207661 m.207661 type:complete len:544 (+) comp15029_c0_seq6:67-1698(+)
MKVDIMFFHLFSQATMAEEASQVKPAQTAREWLEFISQTVEQASDGEMLLSQAPDSVEATLAAPLNSVLSQMTADEPVTTAIHMDESAECERYLKWAEKHRYVRVVRAHVPEGILGVGAKGELFDVRINAPAKIGEDKLYAQDESLRTRVARGNSILRVEQGPTVTYFAVVQALLKFTGGLGDDDDVTDTEEADAWRKFFLQPVEETACAISMQKANGEAAHLSCLYLNGEYVLLCGSKNVHLAARHREDLAKYTDQRYRVALSVGSSVFDMLESLPKSNAQRLLACLANTRLTATMEILQPSYQHVELLKSKQIEFFSWTLPQFEGTRSTLCSLHPVVGLALSKSLGLSPVPYEAVVPANLTNYFEDVRQRVNTEGVVLYFLDKTSFDGNVVGMLKKKTVWYVLLRALREKLRTAVRAMHRNESETPATQLSKVKQRVTARYVEIQRWLKNSDESRETWTALAMDFIDWLFGGDVFVANSVSTPSEQPVELDDKELDQDTAEAVSRILARPSVTACDVLTLFPTVWEKFCMYREAQGKPIVQ